MTLGQEWKNALRAIFAPFSLLLLLVTVALYVGANMVNVGRLQLVLYVVAGLSTSIYGSEVFKRFREVKDPLEVKSEMAVTVLDSVRKALEKRQLSNAEPEDSLLKLVHDQLKDELEK